MRVQACLLLLFGMCVPALARPGSGGPGPVRAEPGLAARAGHGPVGMVADPPSLCERAALRAARAHHLPSRLLMAISLTETGRPDPATDRLRPWPWTINAEGQGQFFATRRDAVAAVRGLQARGVRSIDVGCMQINLMYHPHAFRSLREAFDPQANATFAAHFLNTLYAAGHSWADAVAAYHSEAPGVGDAYRVLVMARLQSDDVRIMAPPADPYQDFSPSAANYGAFQPRSAAYGAFAGAAR